MLSREHREPNDCAKTLHSCTLPGSYCVSYRYVVRRGLEPSLLLSLALALVRCSLDDRSCKDCTKQTHVLNP